MAEVDNTTNGNIKSSGEASEPVSTSYLLKNMILKKIVKESHVQPIEQLFFNKTTKINHNLIASIGGTQATIYDNENRGNNMDVILNFVNVDTPALLELQNKISEAKGTTTAQSEKKKKKDPAKTTAKPKTALPEAEKIDYDNPDRILYCGEWLQAPDNKHDTWLAVAGVDRLIQLISIGRTRAFHILHGHDDAIELMCSTDVVLPSCEQNERNAAQYAHQLLASYSRDGTVRIWEISAFAPDSAWSQLRATKRAKTADQLDAPLNPCLAVLHAPHTTAMTFVPASHGTQLLTATKQGAVQLWDLNHVLAPALNGTDGKKRKADHVTRDLSVPVEVTESRALKSPHKSEIDCLRCLDATHVVSKSMDNRVVLWDWCAQSVARELRVKGKSEAGGARTLFDLSSDGQYLAVGSKSGAVYHYELSTGECIHALEHKRARQSVRACAFSAHCRHVLLVTEAFIWRWDHLDPKTLKEEDRARLSLHGADVLADTTGAGPEPIISEESVDSKPDKLE